MDKFGDRFNQIWGQILDGYVGTDFRRICGDIFTDLDRIWTDLVAYESQE
jgi:hypothetical protein